MRFAGTWKQYSNSAIPQLTSTTAHSGAALSRGEARWPYHANVMNTFERINSRTVRTALAERRRRRSFVGGHADSSACSARPRVRRSQLAARRTGDRHRRRSQSSLTSRLLAGAAYPRRHRRRRLRQRSERFTATLARFVTTTTPCGVLLSSSAMWPRIDCINYIAHATLSLVRLP
jgi:hypothetical protein